MSIVQILGYAVVSPASAPKSIGGIEAVEIASTCTVGTALIDHESGYAKGFSHLCRMFF